MTKRTCQFPKHTCLREINFLKIAGISLLLFCTTSQIAVADSYEKNAVTATQQSKTEKITGKIVDESGEAIIGANRINKNLNSIKSLLYKLCWYKKI